MVDGSASKPALRTDTSYMVEQTYYDIALFSYKKLSLKRGGQLTLSFIWSKKHIGFGQKRPQQTIWLKKITI